MQSLIPIILPPPPPESLEPMNVQKRVNFKAVVMTIVKKFLSSYEGSNIPSTKKATKLLPTIVNYVKGEITSQKKVKPLRSAEDDKAAKEFLALFRNEVLYEIIGINAMAVLCNIGCI